VFHELAPGRIVVIDLKLAIDYREAVSELFLPDRVVDLLKLGIVIFNDLSLVLLVDETVHRLRTVVGYGHDVLV